MPECALRQFHSQVWLRWLPHGTLSWRFLLPKPDPLLRLHRRWWLASVPQVSRPAWLLLEVGLYLRWIMVLAWRECWRVWRRRAREVARVEGMAPAVFGWRLLRLALGSCIPPAQAWQLRLYRDPGHACRWQYVYSHELESFHDWCNRGSPASRKATGVLADKLRLLEQLRGTDVPMAEVCAVLPAGAEAPDWTHWPARLFLKPRFGSAGRGCFIRVADGPDGRWQHFLDSDRRAPLEAWRRQSATSDYLVMPCYGRPEPLAALSPADKAVTLRIITCADRDDVRPLCAFVELAAPRGGFPKIRLDLKSGRPWAAPDQGQAQAWEAAAAYFRRVVVEAVTSATLAHRRAAPGYRAIAWDFLLTDDRALLLEGNGLWDVVPLQQHAGLLSPANEIGACLQAVVAEG